MNAISAQNQGQLAEAFTQLCANVATMVLRILRDFAENPCTLAITGDKYTSKNFFKGSDLEGVDQVYVDLGNPLTRTHAGKLQMARDLLQSGVIGVEDFFSVMGTGDIKASYERQFNEINWINRENELLSQGEAIQVHPLDNHDMHIAYHRSLLQREELRVPKTEQDLAILQVVQAHINQHDQATARAQQMNMPPTPQIPPPDGSGPSGAPLPAPPGNPGAPPSDQPPGQPSPSDPMIQDATGGVPLPTPANPPRV